MVNKIGYPDKWRDYSSVTIARGDFEGNVKHAVDSNRAPASQIGKPLIEASGR